MLTLTVECESFCIECWMQVKSSYNRHVVFVERKEQITKKFQKSSFSIENG